MLCHQIVHDLENAKFLELCRLHMKPLGVGFFTILKPRLLPFTFVNNTLVHQCDIHFNAYFLGTREATA